jgi:hypothetical protein
MKFEFDPHRALTQKEFQYLERMSPSKYHGLKNKGLGPKETDIDGMLRILPEDRQAWHERMAELAESETTKLEAERRREIATAAGRVAAKSPLHISKRKLRRSPG